MDERCCEWHSVTCEPPSELCCDECSEIAHPGHGDGSPCVLDNPVCTLAKSGSREPAKYSRLWTHAEWLMPDGEQASGSFEADVDAVLKVIEALGGTEIRIVPIVNETAR